MPIRPCRTACTVVVALAAFLNAASHAHAADVTVVTAGAFKPVLLALAPAYEARTHTTLAISNDTAGGVAARVQRGEAIDLVILPTQALNTLAAQGKVVAETVTPVAKAGIGAVVKQGAPVPDISSVEAFKQTLLAVPSIAYVDPAAGASSGIYLAKLFDRMGIGDAIRRKTVLVPGGLVASRVANGEVALGLQQISELRAVSGVTFVGPLPAELQNYTIYAAAIPASAQSPAAGRALLAQLRSEAAEQALKASGLEHP
ncbi:MAG: substrate-binding domain-containing protein [Acetobacteraceae bacterium]